MAEQTPQNVNPEVDPQVEDPVSTAVPVADIDRAPAEVNPTVDPQATLPVDLSNAPDPAVAQYYQARAALDDLNSLTRGGVIASVRLADGSLDTVVIPGPDGALPTGRPTYINLGGAESEAEFRERLELRVQQAASELERKGLLDQVRQWDEEDRVAAEAARPPVRSLSEIYPDDEPTIVSAAQIDTAPTEVSGTIDPQATAIGSTAEPALASIDQEPAAVDPAINPEVPQNAGESVAVADVERSAAVVDPAADPEAPQEPDDLPEAFVYQEAQVPETDAIVLAQADATATDVVLVDITGDAIPVDSDLDPTVPQPVEPVSAGGFYGEPTPVGGDYTSVYNPETGTYDVVDLGTGQVVEIGLSQQAATLAAQDLSTGDPQFPNDTPPGDPEGQNLITEPTDVDVAEAQFVETDGGFFELQEEAAPQPDEFGFVETEGGLFVQQDEIEAQIDQAQFEGETAPEEFVPLSEINAEPETVDPNIDLDAPVPDAEGEGEIVEFTANGPVTRDAGEATAEAARIEAQRQNLRNQQAIRDQRGNSVDSADWRVRLRLAPRANYLYLDNEYGPGILDPLAVSDGIIFPYTPTIQTVYKADYTPYNLTHSNYRGFFYQSSYVEDVQITGTFTAQDSVEAAYLLAVIHFFRSATKMFYGGDPQRGAPPPLVYLSAFGQYQYVDAPCVISQFNYNLPADVDYIRARSPNQDGTNLLKRRDRQNLPTNAFSAALQRLKNARPGGLPQGGEVKKPAPPTLGLQSPTYVPTKMDITIVLHPMQSRRQVSQQFSVKEYAPGRLTPKGFW